MTLNPGGFGVLLASSCWLILAACSTVSQLPAGPETSPDVVTELILRWDQAERTNPKCPEAYRAVFVSALKALNNSLAETARERARQ